MKRLTLILLATALTSGCVSIQKGVSLKKGTRILIVDVSKDPVLSSFAVTEYKPLVGRLIEYTKKELAERHIPTTDAAGGDTATLKIDIRTVSRTYRFSVMYRMTLEDPDGKVVFSDEDQGRDSDIDGALEGIASQAAKDVARAFAR